MLYVLISFLCTLLSIASVNTIDKVNYRYTGKVNKNEVYIDYLFQRHYLSYLYCKNRVYECETDKLSKEVDNYLPSSLVNAPFQEEIYSCGTNISNDGNGFVLLTTFKRTDFLKDKVWLKKMVDEKVNEYSVNMLLSVFYTKANMIKEPFFQKINTCVNSFSEKDENIYLVSYFVG